MSSTLNSDFVKESIFLNNLWRVILDFEYKLITSVSVSYTHLARWRSPGDLSGLSILERMGLYKSDLSQAIYSILEMRIACLLYTSLSWLQQRAPEWRCFDVVCVQRFLEDEHEHRFSSGLPRPAR